MNDIKNDNNDNLKYIKIDGINLNELFLILKKWWLLPIGLFLITVIVTTIVSLRMIPIYQASTTMLPITSESNNYSNLNILFSPVNTPIPFGQTNVNKIMAILKSRTIIEKVIQNMDLYKILLEEKPQQRDPLKAASDKLFSMVSIYHDLKTGIITVLVNHKDPEVARDIANQYLIELESTLKEKAFTVTKTNKVFIEEQLLTEETELIKLQKELTTFQKETRMMEIIEPEDQVKSTMDLYADLISQKITLEVELKRIESALSEGNPRITALTNQMDALNNEIKKIEEKTQIGVITSFEDPQDKLFIYSNIVREINTSQTIYETLLKIYEQLKFEEIRDNLYVEIIDPAITPDAPIKPKKKRMVGLAGLSSLIIGGLLILFLEWIKSMIKNRSA